MPEALPTSTSTPWVEKYRPKSLTDVSHQTEVVSTLQNAVKTNRLPHLLFYGPPGTGKTSVALALCRTLYDPSQINRRVLELNASDERGISVVRNKIRHFAQLAVGSSGTSTVGGQGKMKKNFFKAQGSKKGNDEEKEKDGADDDKMDTGEDGTDTATKSYPNPPFKIIILDEADTVTPDAQAALRRIIEAHSKITRFILICNYVTRIIDPLASRCTKFRFQPLPPASMKQRLTTIAHAEYCRFGPPTTMSDDNDDESNQNEEEVLDEILELSQGDMRRAVTCLQSAHMLSVGSTADDSDSNVNTSGYIQKDNIAEMAGLPPLTVVESLLSILGNQKSSFDDMEKAVQDIMLEGFAAQHILSLLLTEILSLDSNAGDGASEGQLILSEVHKSRIVIKMAEVDKNLVDGADELLQLLMVCSLILQCFKSG